MKALQTTAWVRHGLLAVLLTTALACCRDKEPVTPDQPVSDPTPYNLVLPANFNQTPTQPLDNPLTVEGVELGRHLFYEKALSIDNTVSCASCHKQALAFTDGLARATGVHGSQHARSTMPIQNMLWEKDMAWDGATKTLETQARVPLQNPIEMGQSVEASAAKLQQMPKYVTLFNKAFKTKVITSDNLLKALAQFERTLISGNSRYDRYMRGEFSALTAEEIDGEKLFNQHPQNEWVNGRQVFVRGANCGDCHKGNLQNGGSLQSGNIINNGLDVTFTDLGLGAVTGKSSDNGKFKVASLRNINLTAPYMHDGRFNTLEEVLDHYSDHVKRNSPNIEVNMLTSSNDPDDARAQLGMTAAEKRKVIAFLKTLTDEDFVRDPRFAAPAP
ncbi:cytochrome c peroxidase [Hymenobacter sp. ASUV-10]|uniref:Cytochrome c peroxidase n=1 Tax=Hymenobacter aranciens TaxID=3063996 RepID=A0ABT9BGV0_9BACT|nr:cytochrome c peroxidase [Hymenobacter sp. ASUV-10]MDO7877471.1 cytochrome c peroxidase [Hymenobacter sp. ASUV-10]